MRYPWTKRDLEKCIYDMKCADDEDRTSVRAEIAKSSGFTGLCILHRLRALYGFDVLKHLVIDAMHNIPLNVVRNHIYHYIDDGIIPAHVVEERLLKIPWTQGKLHVVIHPIYALANNYFRVKKWPCSSFINQAFGILES